MKLNRPTRSNWLFWARLAWLLLFIMTVGKIAIGLPVEYAQMNKPCLAPEEVCSQDDYLTPQQIRELDSIGLSLTDYARLKLVWFVSISLVFAGVGLFIFILRPNDWLAIIASGMLIVFNSAGLESEIRAVDPALGIAADVIFNLGNILIFLFIGLFPSGRFSPRWMRWYWLGMILISILPSTAWLQKPEIANIAIVIFWFSFLILGPFSQIYRYRNESTTIERQQTKWVVMGFAFMAGGVLILGAINLSGVLSNKSLSSILQNGFFFDFASLLLPLSIGFSVLRYRLWDIDVIIRRTFQYALLSGLLSLVYFGGVALLQAILTAGNVVGGQPSAVVIVITTLATAALFSPLRKRIQEFIDRRFYRRKYDAEKIVTAFSERLRDEVNLGDLQNQIVSVVEETLQPEQASLWLTRFKP